MSAADLIALAERCEAAVGQDDLLDAEIMVAIKSETFFTARVYMVGTRAMSGAGPDADWRNATVFFKEVRFTASLDAALTLVPEDCLFTARTVWDKMKPAGLGFVSRYEKGEFGGHERLYWMDEHQAVAATPALALCAAALRARASLPAVAPTGFPTGPTSLHSLGTGAAEATGESR